MSPIDYGDNKKTGKKGRKEERRRSGGVRGLERRAYRSVGVSLFWFSDCGCVVYVEVFFFAFPGGLFLGAK
jgi:hypothetical protein